jgi:hypothetical protein
MKYRVEGYKCPFPDCGATFRTPQSLGGHVISQHSGVDLDWIIAQKEKAKRRDLAKTNEVALWLCYVARGRQVLYQALPPRLSKLFVRAGAI